MFFVFIVPIMYAFRDTPLPTFCKYICPAGTIEGGLGLLSHKVNAGYFSMLGPLFTWKFILMISIVSVYYFNLILFIIAVRLSDINTNGKIKPYTKALLMQGFCFIMR